MRDHGPLSALYVRVVQWISTTAFQAVNTGSIPVTGLRRHGAMAAQLFRKQQVSGSSPGGGLRVKLEGFHGGLISHVHGFKSRTRYLADGLLGCPGDVRFVRLRVRFPMAMDNRVHCCFISLRSTILVVRRTVYPEVAGSYPVGVAWNMWFAGKEQYVCCCIVEYD